jgi:multiple sugar transport system ATP-binding protein
MAELVVESASKAFGPTIAVNDVSLEVRDGELAVLLGPSGCGKTTLLRLVAGFERPDRGRILIDGTDVTATKPGDRDVAMVFQGYALYPHMTVFDNIAFGLRSIGLPKREVAERVERVATSVEIQGLLGRRPGTLSGGQRQRVALARAISREPKVFLMDEPLSNLDTQLRASMRIEIKRLQGELGATVLYVTHDQVEAMTMGTKVAVLHAGRIAQVGTPEEVYDRSATEFVATFIGSPPMNLLRGALQRDGSSWRFEGSGAEIVLPAGWRYGATEATPGGVSLGVRPEDLHLGAARPPGSVPLGVCCVEVTEPMGHETVVHLRLGPSRLAARVPGTWQAEPGAEVAVAADPGRIQLFDAQTGSALGREVDRQPALA